MQVHVHEVSPVQKKVSIEIPADRVDAEIEKVYAGIQKKAKLQGFRPGKAPMHIIKRSYTDAMRDEVTRRIYEQTLFKALDDHKIEPVDTPLIESEMFEPGAPFKYNALVEVMPLVTIKDYSGLLLKKEKYTASLDAVEGELKRMQENMAELVPLDEDAIVENGNTVCLDYAFSVEGFPEESSSAEDATVEVGAKRLLGDFEDQLVGMKCGESKEIRITLPENYRTQEAAGKDAVFNVTLKEVKRKDLPELDDDFAQQFGEYDTIQELRDKMAEYREKHELDRIASDLKERAINALIEKNPLEVPGSMVKRQLEYMLENLKNRLKSQHMSLDMMGLDEEGFRGRFQAEAADKVRGGLLLMSLVEKENITVSDDDLDVRYQQMAAGNDDMLKRIREYYGSSSKARNSVIAEIKEDKAVSFLLDNAVVTEVDAADLKTA